MIIVNKGKNREIDQYMDMKIKIIKNNIKYVASAQFF